MKFRTTFLLLLALSQSKIALASGQPLNVFVLGDWGHGNSAQKRVAAAMARESDRLRRAGAPLRFTVSTGDNFYERGVSSVGDAKWKAYFENVYDKRRLNAPFFAVLGNHDWLGNARAQIEYSKTPGTRWRMDNFWYRRSFYRASQAAKNEQPLLDVFFLDTNAWVYGRRTQYQAQTRWLNAALKNSRSRWKIVVGHHPLFTDGLHAVDSGLLDLRAALLPLLQRHNVAAYVGGHDHDLQRIVHPKWRTLFLVSGGGGEKRRRLTRNYRPFYRATTGFLALSFDEKTMRGRFLDERGAVLDSFSKNF